MNGPHPSHKRIRGSDASSFDYICDDCGARDQVPGGWGSLAQPCKPSLPSGTAPAVKGGGSASTVSDKQT